MKGAADGFCRPRARRTIISNSGTWTAPWSVFIMRSTWRFASKRDGKQARQQRPSLRRAQRMPEKGFGSILRATTRQKEVDAMGLLLSAVVHPAMSRTVTAPSSCCDGRDDCFHSSNALLMADMPETRCARRLRTHGGCASSSVSMLPASRSCPNAGIVEQTFYVDQPQSPLGS